MNLFVWTHHDLDGAVSYLIIKWLFGEDYNIKYATTNPMTFREDYLHWLATDDEDYEKMFILDLDISEFKKLVDLPNVVIIDHHESHLNCKYINAKYNVKLYKSACALLYSMFKDKFKFTPEQKALISLATDYDCYELKFKESRILNTVFWDTQGKFETFIKTFENGFSAFTKSQINIWNLHQQNLRKMLKTAEFFGAKNINISGQKCSVIAAKATKFINEIAEFIFVKTNADVAMIVNTETNHVSVRRNKDSEVNILPFTTDICEGGGHKEAAGGKITPKFLEFTKKLLNINNEKLGL
jgi:oligoribonuclease NrnB/cAMP/cGMP phosphodiesterase (DHH superfamily)